MTGNVPSTTLDPVNVTAPAPSTTVYQSSGGVPWAKRLIQLTMQLGGASFSGGGNTLTVSGLRTHCQITKASLPSAGMAYVRIQGLTLDQINSFTKAGTAFYLSADTQNSISIAAGEVGGALTTIFSGLVFQAYPEFGDQPDVAFVIQANSTMGAQLQSAKPVSFPGNVAIDQALTQILQPIGATVQNNGVNATLASPYFPGSTWDQVRSAVRAANCMAAYDDAKKVLTIWPRSGGTMPGTPVLISSQTGMIGYPEFESARVVVRVLFAPNVFLGPGQQLMIQSQLSAANGTFTINNVDYNLSAELPGGPWETIVTANPTSFTGSSFAAGYPPIPPS